MSSVDQLKMLTDTQMSEAEAMSLLASLTSKHEAKTLGNADTQATGDNERDAPHETLHKRCFTTHWTDTECAELKHENGPIWAYVTSTSYKTR